MRRRRRVLPTLRGFAARAGELLPGSHRRSSGDSGEQAASESAERHHSRLDAFAPAGGALDNGPVNEATRRRVAEARIARLATTDADGRPHLVPIVFVLDGETLYSAVDDKPKRSRRLRRLANAAARPDVTVLVDHYEEEWTRLWWVRLRGRARVLEAGAEAERALALLTAKYAQYRERPPRAPVLAVDVVEWRSWEGG